MSNEHKGAPEEIIQSHDFRMSNEHKGLQEGMISTHNTQHVTYPSLSPNTVHKYHPIIQINTNHNENDQSPKYCTPSLQLNKSDGLRHQQIIPQHTTSLSNINLISDPIKERMLPSLSNIDHDLLIKLENNKKSNLLLESENNDDRIELYHDKSKIIQVLQSKKSTRSFEKSVGHVTKLEELQYL